MSSPIGQPLPRMPTLGLLTGVSYVSGIDYYRGINERIAKLLPKDGEMERNSDMVIVSVDCAEYVRLLTAKDVEAPRKHRHRRSTPDAKKQGVPT
eukprot:3725737-Amphidinium_carterae.1